MNTWTPIFSKLVDSSVWSEPDYVCKVFVTLLALKDSDQVVRHTAFAIGKKCWPTDEKAEERALEAFKILASPDNRRIEPQPFEGRRIEKVEDGWLVLNGLYYEDMMRSISRKVYKARKQREYRAMARGKPLHGEVAAVKALENGDEREFERIAAAPRRGDGEEVKGGVVWVKSVAQAAQPAQPVAVPLPVASAPDPGVRAVTISLEENESPSGP
jgi:hypothetical protein